MDRTYMLWLSGWVVALAIVGFVAAYFERRAAARTRRRDRR